MEIRLIGKFEEVEAITRDLRQLFNVVRERELARRRGDGIIRYLTIVFSPEPGRGTREAV